MSTELLGNPDIQRELSRIRPDLREETAVMLTHPGAERPEADDPAWAAVIDAAFRAEVERSMGPYYTRMHQAETAQESVLHRLKRVSYYIGERLTGHH